MDYDHILGATDFSTLGDIALQRAARLAKASGASLTALHVLPEPEMPSPLFAHYEVKTDASKLEHAKKEAIAALRERIPEEVLESNVEIRYEIRVGDPASEILTADVQLHPDLIVLATHGRRGWRRWIMGSVAERIVQMAHADVLAVRVHDDDEGEE